MDRSKIDQAATDYINLYGRKGIYLDVVDVADLVEGAVWDIPDGFLLDSYIAYNWGEILKGRSVLSETEAETILRIFRGLLVEVGATESVNRIMWEVAWRLDEEETPISQANLYTKVENVVDEYWGTLLDPRPETLDRKRPGTPKGMTDYEWGCERFGYNGEDA